MTERRVAWGRDVMVWSGRHQREKGGRRGEDFWMGITTLKKLSPHGSIHF